MTDEEIQSYRLLAESEENPHVLARALGRVLDNYVFLRELGKDTLEGSETAKDFLRELIGADGPTGG